jgi:hypothetical protein
VSFESKLSGPKAPRSDCTLQRGKPYACGTFIIKLFLQKLIEKLFPAYSIISLGSAVLVEFGTAPTRRFAVASVSTAYDHGLFAPLGR